MDQLCPTRQLLGAHRPGAYAEYVNVPAQSLMLFPDEMPLRLGTLTEPVGCAVCVGELAGSVSGKTCLIIGAGPIGPLSLQVILHLNALKVFIVDLDPERLAMGVEMGGQTIDARRQDVVRQTTNNKGVALAIDVVGTAVTRQQCISAMMLIGTVILSGLPEQSSVMPAADIIRRNIVVRGSFAYSPSNFATAIALLVRGKIRLDPWIVESPLADGGQRLGGL